MPRSRSTRDFIDSDYFFALVFETTGAINAEGTRVLSQIFRFAASRLGHEFSSYCSCLGPLVVRLAAFGIASDPHSL